MSPSSPRAREQSGISAPSSDHPTAEAKRERRTQQLAALSRMGQSVVSSLDLEKVLRQVVDEVSELLPTHEISILLREKQDLVFAVVSGRAAHALQGKRMPSDVGIAGEVMRNGVSSYVSGAEADARMYLDIDQLAEYRPHSLLAVPLKLGSQVFGVLEAVHAQVNAFSEEDLNVLDAAANWAAIAIANAQQHEELRRRFAETVAMSNINLALNETLELNEIFERIVKAAQEIIPNTEKAVIHLLQQPDQELQAVAVAAPGGNAKNGIRMHLGEGIAGQVLVSGVPINVGQVAGDPRFLLHGLAPNICSLLVVPMQSGTRRLGTISVQSAAPNAFSVEDEHLLARLGIQASIAITNAQLFEQVRSGREQLQALSRQLLENQEAERQLIVRELYGEIGQELSALKMNLLALEKASPENSLTSRFKESAALTERVLDRVRAMSLDLRPSLLDDLGLAAALRWLLDQQSQRAGFAGEFYVDGLQERLAPPIETACFRVAQEALANIARHARAHQVMLQIKTCAEHLDLIIRDDGIGFDVADARNLALRGEGLGLLGMEERARLVGGRLEIESARGYGTEIRARLPIAPRQSSAHGNAASEIKEQVR